MKYALVSGDEGFLVRDGIDLLVETARMWVDLGFWRTNGDRTFHIHGVTGPDEYTTVVNNNLFTNVMARFNLEAAVRAVEHVRATYPVAWTRAASRLEIVEGEVEEWRRVCGGDVDPVRREPGHPPAGRLLPRPRGLGPVAHPCRALPAAAALPPAGDLPLPGAQAGRRGAGDVPAGRPVHPRGEARQRRVLRPDHHRRLQPVGDRPVDRRRRGGLPRGGPQLLPPGALRRPAQPARQHRRRAARRLGRRSVADARARLRRVARPRRHDVLRPEASGGLESRALQPGLAGARRGGRGDRGPAPAGRRGPRGHGRHRPARRRRPGHAARHLPRGHRARSSATWWSRGDRCGSGSTATDPGCRRGSAPDRAPVGCVPTAAGSPPASPTRCATATRSRPASCRSCCPAPTRSRPSSPAEGGRGGVSRLRPRTPTHPRSAPRRPAP